jgi:hypothetical protein
MNSYILIFILVSVYLAVVVGLCYLMIYHKGGVKSGNWEEDK